MNLFHEFSRKAPNKVFASIMLGALAGISYAFLIPVVLNGLAREPSGFIHNAVKAQTFLSVEVSNFKFAGLFFALCLIILAARTTSQLLLIGVSIDFATGLRTRLYDRIAKASTLTVDGIGPAKLTAVLTEDVRRVVIGARMLPDVLVSMITVIGMLSFLLYLNQASFYFVIKALVFGVISFQLPVYLGSRFFARSSTINDTLQVAIRGLISGVKELKLDVRKRNAYFSKVLLTREKALSQSDKTAYTTMALATNYGDLISFLVIGIVAFVFVNYHSISTEELVGVIMALLYVTGPVAVVLYAAPTISMAKVSLQRIEKMIDEMAEEPSDGVLKKIAPWETISFKGVSFQHTNSSGKGFQMGPVDFNISKGEITFIVGGNGSGKSTLSKLISQHYFPDTGTITFGDQVVMDGIRDNFRYEIAAIFSDYHLFDRLLGDTSPATMSSAKNYLDEFGLAEKVSIADGVFSTISLSDGQRKRLALLVAFLEDKNLYLFDEWAADQDPAFKEIFYRKILPDLKSRGKAVVVISHDDRYFDVADKVLEMENGKMVKTRVKHDGKPLDGHRSPDLPQPEIEDQTALLA